MRNPSGSTLPTAWWAMLAFILSALWVTWPLATHMSTALPVGAYDNATVTLAQAWALDHMADKVGVMYLGRLVELQAKHDLFSMPGHPYTRLLIEAAPSRKRFGRESAPLTGETPSPLAPPPGCAFHTRCPHTDPRCRTEVPNLLPFEKGGAVACHRIQEGGI